MFDLEGWGDGGVEGCLCQIISKKEAAHRVLYASAHLDEVLEHVLGCRLLRIYVDRAHREQQVEARQHVSCVLD